MNQSIAPTLPSLRPAPSTVPAADPPTVRHDWTAAEVEALIDLPFPDLLFRAQTVHRACFDPTRIQLSTLMSIKTGGCVEDCGYCSQSAHHDTGLTATKLASPNLVLQKARDAQVSGATRFCMGAAWREPKDRDLDTLCDMISSVKALGLQTCATLGMLQQHQADRLAAAGLDYYNHNLDTSERYYPAVVTTRSYQDRLTTLQNVRAAGMNVCCGGIIGLGENNQDQAALIATLAGLPEHPQSVPLNRLVSVPGTPLAECDLVDAIRFTRIVAAARIALPRSYIRLSAGRESFNDEAQALCFLAGANSIFVGDQLLTAPNTAASADQTLLHRLGMLPES